MKKIFIFVGLLILSGASVFVYIQYEYLVLHVNRLSRPIPSYFNGITAYNEIIHDSCNNYNTSIEHCSSVYSKPGKSKTKYPLQMVSGMPGSGNDWILWLGSVIGYNGTNEYLLDHCEVYHGWKWTIPHSNSSNQTYRYSNCVYIKTHEPYFLAKGDLRLQIARKAAVILRHPFDAAYSEYKRQRVFLHMTDEERKDLLGMKSSPRANLSDFFKLSSTHDIKSSNAAMNEKWVKFALAYVGAWEIHARYWLEEWDKPIRPIIYPDFKANVRTQLPELLLYFGQSFDTSVLDKLCCVLENPYNPELKRKKADVDKFKEYIYEKTPNLLSKYTAAVNKIQPILDKRWPNQYRIARG